MVQRVWRRRWMLGAALAWLGNARAAVPEAVGRVLPRVKVALVAGHSLYQLPLTLADQLGYFRQAGIAVEWVNQDAGVKAVSSILTGQADVLSASFEHLFVLQQKGLNFQSFVQLSRTPQVSLGLAVRSSQSARSLVDWRGMRVGVSSLNSSTHWMASRWLLQNGLLPEDVVFVPVGSSPAVIERLRTGAIDALCNPDPVMHWLEQKNEVRLLGEARSLAATRKLLGGPVPGACLMASADFLQRHPERAQALSDGVVHALKWLQTAGLTDILKTVPAHHWLGDRAVYLGAFEKLRESYALDGVMRAEEVVNAWRAHARLISGKDSLPVAPEKTYTNVLAQKSKVRFAA